MIVMLTTSRTTITTTATVMMVSILGSCSCSIATMVANPPQLSAAMHTLTLLPRLPRRCWHRHPHQPRRLPPASPARGNSIILTNTTDLLGLLARRLRPIGSLHRPRPLLRPRLFRRLRRRCVQRQPPLPLLPLPLLILLLLMHIPIRHPTRRTTVKTGKTQKGAAYG